MQGRSTYRVRFAHNASTTCSRVLLLLSTNCSSAISYRDYRRRGESADVRTCHCMQSTNNFEVERRPTLALKPRLRVIGHQSTTRPHSELLLAINTGNNRQRRLPTIHTTTTRRTPPARSPSTTDRTSYSCTYTHTKPCTPHTITQPRASTAEPLNVRTTVSRIVNLARIACIAISVTEGSRTCAPLSNEGFIRPAIRLDDHNRARLEGQPTGLDRITQTTHNQPHSLRSTAFNIRQHSTAFDTRQHFSTATKRRR